MKSKAAVVWDAYPSRNTVVAQGHDLGMPPKSLASFRKEHLVRMVPVKDLLPLIRESQKVTQGQQDLESLKAALDTVKHLLEYSED